MNNKYFLLIGIFLLVIIPGSLMAQASYIQRVNAGGSSYTTGGGDIFDADQEYTGGGWGYVGGNTWSTSDPISNTTDDQLYQTEHWGMSAYRFTVDNGDYEVILLCRYNDQGIHHNRSEAIA